MIECKYCKKPSPVEFCSEVCCMSFFGDRREDEQREIVEREQEIEEYKKRVLAFIDDYYGKDVALTLLMSSEDILVTMVDNKEKE